MREGGVITKEELTKLQKRVPKSFLDAAGILKDRKEEIARHIKKIRSEI